MSATELDELRLVAYELVGLMDEYEIELAHAVEAELFPEGVPDSISPAVIVRAQAAALSRSAENLARVDMAYQEARKAREQGVFLPGDDDEGRSSEESLMSPDVAYKMARSAELELLMDQHAEMLGASMEQRFFPAGLPQPLTVQHLLAAVRQRLVQALKESRAENPDEDEAASRLGDEIVSAAYFYAGFAECGHLRELSTEIAELAGLPEPLE